MVVCYVSAALSLWPWSSLESVKAAKKRLNAMPSQTNCTKFFPIEPEKLFEMPIQIYANITTTKHTNNNNNNNSDDDPRKKMREKKTIQRSALRRCEFVWMIISSTFKRLILSKKSLSLAYSEAQQEIYAQSPDIMSTSIH